MAHELEIKNGIASMVYVGEAPWHRLGTLIPANTSAYDALKLAGLDWTVSFRALQTADGTPVAHRAVVRDTDGSVLGCVGPESTLLQNTQQADFIQPFISSGEANIETAGALREGRVVWMLAKLQQAQDSVIVAQADDRVSKYLLISNSHDGSMAIRVGFTPIRVVCNNTLTMAVGSNASNLLKIKHRGNLEDTLQRVQAVVNAANASFEATADQYRRLAATSINMSTLEKYVKIVFAQRKSALATAEEDLGIVATQDNSGERILNKIVPLFEHGRGNDLPGVQGTMWAAYNAVTEYIQYERGTDPARRLDSTWYGTGAQLNRKALTAAMELVAA